MTVSASAAMLGRVALKLWTVDDGELLAQSCSVQNALAGASRWGYETDRAMRVLSRRAHPSGYAGPRRRKVLHIGRGRRHEIAPAYRRKACRTGGSVRRVVSHQIVSSTSGCVQTNLSFATARVFAGGHKESAALPLMPFTIRQNCGASEGRRRDIYNRQRPVGDAVVFKYFIAGLDRSVVHRVRRSLGVWPLGWTLLATMLLRPKDRIATFSAQRHAQPRRRFLRNFVTISHSFCVLCRQIRHGISADSR